jgi:hypothetical protein
MECTKCKTHNNYYHNYCHSCGAKLDNSTAKVTYQEAIVGVNTVILNKHREFFNPYKERSQKWRTTIYTSLVSAIVLLGAVCWIIVSTQK